MPSIWAVRYPENRVLSPSPIRLQGGRYGDDGFCFRPAGDSRLQIGLGGPLVLRRIFEQSLCPGRRKNPREREAGRSQGAMTL
jgi:hypothetical protein